MVSYHITDKEGSGSSELSEVSSPPANVRSVDQPERNPEVEDIKIENVHDCIKPETSDNLVSTQNSAEALQTQQNLVPSCEKSSERKDPCPW